MSNPEGPSASTTPAKVPLSDPAAAAPPPSTPSSTLPSSTPPSATPELAAPPPMPPASASPSAFATPPTTMPPTTLPAPPPSSPGEGEPPAGHDDDGDDADDGEDNDGEFANADDAPADDLDQAAPAPENLAEPAKVPDLELASVEGLNSSATTLLGRQRGRAGAGLGTGLAALAVLVALVPAAVLVMWAHTDVPVDVDADVGAGPGADVAAGQGAPTSTEATRLASARTAADTLATALAAALAEQEAALVEVRARAKALEERARVAEQGDRLRLLQRQVATAREVRRSEGQSGAALRGPFPAAELDGVKELGFGARRWLMGRDGNVLAPAGITPPVDLASTTRDEDPSVFSTVIAEQKVNLERRCLPSEAYCIVDVVDVVDGVGGVEAGVVAAVSPSSASAALAALRASLSSSSSPSSSAAKAAADPPSSPPWRRPLVADLLAALAVAGGLFLASRLRHLGSAIRQMQHRLQATLAGRAPSTPSGLPAELAAVDAVVDEVEAFLRSNEAAAAERQHVQRRLLLVAQTLAAAVAQGKDANIGADPADPPVLAALAAQTDTLLEALYARAIRHKKIVDEAESATKVLQPLAHRLLRVARVPGLPQAVVDELTSLGTAVGQRARIAPAMQKLKVELAQLAPSRPDIMEQSAAMNPLGREMAARLVKPSSTSASSGSSPASSSPPRPASQPQSISTPPTSLSGLPSGADDE